MGARLGRALPGATLHVLHVFRTSRLERGYAWSAGVDTEALEDAKEHLESHVRAASAQCRNQVTGHFVVGDPTAEILRACSELKVETLVIGTHDQSGFERLLLGSVAETLTRKCGCSVFVVRPVKRR